MGSPDVGVSDLIGASTGEAIRVAQTQPRRISGGGNRQRQAGVAIHDAGNLPTAKEMSCHPFLRLEPRQFVDEVGVEDLPPVKLRGTILGSDIVSVLGSPEVALRSRQAVRVRVVQ